MHDCSTSRRKDAVSVTVGEAENAHALHLAAPTATWARFASTQSERPAKPPDGAKNEAHPNPVKPVKRVEGEDEEGSRYENLTLPVAYPGSPGGSGSPGGGGLFPITRTPFFDAALTTFIGLGMVFLGGVAYINWYKWNVLVKMEKAFDAGYDPALDVATHSKNGDALDDQDHETKHLRRREQDLVDRIISGQEKGHYWMLLGSKGTGKTTMIFDAMTKVNAEGVSVCDAHPDMEVFRLRLGRALNFEFNEDTQTGLFQRRDPREGGPPLDIERALNKLEKIALRRARKTGRPLVLVFNNVHFFQHTDEGRNMLLQLQQRAESWAESRIMTMVFTTDDFWPFLVMRKTASRMMTLSIFDLERNEALQATRRLSRSYWDTAKHPNEPPENDETFKRALSYIGGRLSFIGKAIKSENIVASAQDMVQKEKGWLLSQIGLIPDHDDDVMDEQKWSSCSWLLLREFVRLYKEHEQSGAHKEDGGDFFLPRVSYDKARQLMTRTDFIDDLDRSNIISIDVDYNVRPDSMVLLQAAREVVEMPGFDDLLDNVRNRVDEIESLHRTRELTVR
ncbi:hypothetical protein M0805_009552, partial [Coniferiporia weirii]